MHSVKTIGILTGGGDAPGLNAVIRASVRKCHKEKIKALGFRGGWKGIVDGVCEELDGTKITGILPKGGTILGTSRTNPYKMEGAVQKIKDNFKKFSLDALIAIGGEDTLGVARKLSAEGLPVVGVPKTIDNDLSGTDYTFGFDTAVSIATEAIDRLHTTTESHSRVMVVEIMGRHAGWITAAAGMAGGADVVIIPEKIMKISEICGILGRRHMRSNFSIVAVSEGARIDMEENRLSEITQDSKLDAFGHIRLGGIGKNLAEILEKKLGIESRYVVLGHLQRGGTPTAFDRILGLRLGLKAMELVLESKFGYMAALKGTEVVGIKLDDAVSRLKTVNDEYFKVAELFFD